MTMRVFNRGKNLRGNFQRIAPGKLLFGLDQFIKRQTVYIFHDDILNVVVISHVIDRDDIRVGKLLRRRGLVSEAFDKLLIVAEFLF